jgi:hypothetical protein
MIDIRNRKARLSRVSLTLPITVGVSLLLVLMTTVALSQSGRRKTDASRQSPVPQPSATPSPEESESQPRPKPKNASMIATFVVYESDDVFMDSTFGSPREIVSQAFYERIKQSPNVGVERGGRATRGSARDRAKKEREAYVVFIELEEDRMTPRTQSSRRGTTDYGYLAIRIYVYAPGTGNLKYTDTITQRPYRDTATIGGVRIPVPTTTRTERYPGERQLAQAGRDAADRVLSRFDIARPPYN